MRLSSNGSFQVTTEGGGFYELNGSNSSEDKAFFALPIVIGILGVFDFLVIGVLLLYYFSRNQSQV